MTRTRSVPTILAMSVMRPRSSTTSSIGPSIGDLPIGLPIQLHRGSNAHSHRSIRRPDLLVCQLKNVSPPRISSTPDNRYRDRGEPRNCSSTSSAISSPNALNVNCAVIGLPDKGRNALADHHRCDVHVFARMQSGMIDASTTFRFSIPRTLPN